MIKINLFSIFTEEDFKENSKPYPVGSLFDLFNKKRILKDRILDDTAINLINSHIKQKNIKENDILKIEYHEEDYILYSDDFPRMLSKCLVGLILIKEIKND